MRLADTVEGFILKCRNNSEALLACLGIVTVEVELLPRKPKAANGLRHILYNFCWTGGSMGKVSDTIDLASACTVSACGA